MEHTAAEVGWEERDVSPPPLLRALSSRRNESDDDTPLVTIAITIEDDEDDEDDEDEEDEEVDEDDADTDPQSVVRASNDEDEEVDEDDADTDPQSDAGCSDNASDHRPQQTPTNGVDGMAEGRAATPPTAPVHAPAPTLPVESAVKADPFSGCREGEREGGGGGGGGSGIVAASMHTDGGRPLRSAARNARGAFQLSPSKPFLKGQRVLAPWEDGSTTELYPATVLRFVDEVDEVEVRFDANQLRKNSVPMSEVKALVPAAHGGGRGGGGGAAGGGEIRRRSSSSSSSSISSSSSTPTNTTPPANTDDRDQTSTKKKRRRSDGNEDAADGTPKYDFEVRDPDFGESLLHEQVRLSCELLIERNEEVRKSKSGQPQCRTKGKGAGRARVENSEVAVLLAESLVTVKDMLACNAPVNTTDKGGGTPLHEACSHSHTELVRLLLTEASPHPLSPPPLSSV
jgi:hypothetical protein